MLFAYVLLSLSKQKLRARMKEAAVHRLHKNEISHLAVAVPVPPAHLARWPLSTVCKAQPEQANAVHGITIQSSRLWSQTLMFEVVVQIPGDTDSCVTCKFSTVVPVISCLQLLARGKMRSGFFCMGGNLLPFQGKRAVILVLLDCT